jgi:hypothetical protein
MERDHFRPGVLQGKVGTALRLKVTDSGLADEADGNRRNATQSRDLAKLFNRGIKDATERAETLNHQLGGNLHVFTGNRQGEEEFDGFVVLKRLETAFQKPIPESLPVAVVVWLVHANSQTLARLSFTLFGNIMKGEKCELLGFYAI